MLTETLIGISGTSLVAILTASFKVGREIQANLDELKEIRKDVIELRKDVDRIDRNVTNGITKRGNNE